MFSTFATNSQPTSGVDGSKKSQPKRRQVARACAWCRTYRIKCDANIPCQNCCAKHRVCTIDNSSGRDEVRTFPAAIKEIDRLRKRVHDLEHQIEQLHIRHGSSPNFVPPEDDAIAKQEEALPEELDPLAQHGSNHKYYNWSIATRVTNHGSSQAYGASSIVYFIDRLSSYLDTTLNHVQAPKFSSSSVSASTLLFDLRDSFTDTMTAATEPVDVHEDLSYKEEARLLATYWDQYHVMYPILERETFEVYYRSLWENVDTSRHASALVDVMLAICMQHDAVRDGAVPDLHSQTPNASSLAGWWFLRRSQYILQDQIEQPTIMTFQSYAIAVLWLAQASWQNAAHNLLATTLRVGVVLGLHLEPSLDLPPSIRGFRRRLWWTVYATEARYAMEYGRPIAVNFLQVTCNPPKPNATPTSGVTMDMTAEAINTQTIRLILATRSIYILFYRECARVLRQNGSPDMSQYAEGIESCAEWFETKIGYLRAWSRHVPANLKPAREHPGQPYSTDHSRLDTESLKDPWSHLGIILEILYHTSAMTLYRHFLAFTKRGAQLGLKTEQHATDCANHGITIINIINQELQELGSLRTWRDVCSHQLNASITLVGYIVAYPKGAATHTAHKAVGTAISSFEHLAYTFLRAHRAAELLREALALIDGGIVQGADASAPGSDSYLQEGPVVLQNDMHGTSTRIDDADTVQASYVEDGVQSADGVAFASPDLGSRVYEVNAEDWLDSLLDFSHTMEP